MKTNDQWVYAKYLEAEDVVCTWNNVDYVFKRQHADLVTKNFPIPLELFCFLFYKSPASWELLCLAGQEANAKEAKSQIDSIFKYVCQGVDEVKPEAEEDLQKAVKEKVEKGKEKKSKK